MWHDYFVLEYIWLLPILGGGVMAAVLIAVPKITDILRRRKQNLSVSSSPTRVSGSPGPNQSAS
jgi:hypothetical protein